MTSEGGQYSRDVASLLGISERSHCCIFEAAAGNWLPHKESWSEVTKACKTVSRSQKKKDRVYFCSLTYVEKAAANDRIYLTILTKKTPRFMTCVQRFEDRGPVLIRTCVLLSMSWSFIFYLFYLLVHSAFDILNTTSSVLKHYRSWCQNQNISEEEAEGNLCEGGFRGVMGLLFCDVVLPLWRLFIVQPFSSTADSVWV